ncbi:acyl-CoA dehydrogenase family protein [uncultured Albimonas sp.]|uniref:acyl-CoA dehydrogenase family protein n=1 Tax=uncultured Albimonas sp. TaxID=1331701 RepID=UPI0030EE743A
MDSGFQGDDPIVAAAARFVDRAFDFERRARVVADPEGEGARLWSELGDAGMLGLRAPEDAGGVNATAAQTARVLEAFGSGLMIAPFVPGAVICMEILRGSTTPAAASLIERVALGEARPALAYLEPGRRHADARFGATLGADARISGRKTAAWGAAYADALVIAATDAQGATALALVDPAGPGVEVQGYATYDGGDAAEIVLDGAPAVEILAAGPGAEALLRRALDLGALALAAEAVGVMAQAVDITREYLVTRKQFGRPLSANQALAHRMVEIWCEVDLSRALVARAAHAFDADPEGEGHRMAAAAKAFAAEAGRLVGQECVQMHGAMGVTAEARISHHYKRLVAIDTVCGSVATNLARFAAAA